MSSWTGRCGGTAVRQDQSAIAASASEAAPPAPDGTRVIAATADDNDIAIAASEADGGVTQSSGAIDVPRLRRRVVRPEAAAAGVDALALRRAGWRKDVTRSFNGVAHPVDVTEKQIAAPTVANAVTHQGGNSDSKCDEGVFKDVDEVQRRFFLQGFQQLTPTSLAALPTMFSAPASTGRLRLRTTRCGHRAQMHEREMDSGRVLAACQMIRARVLAQRKIDHRNITLVMTRCAPGARDATNIISEFVSGRRVCTTLG